MAPMNTDRLPHYINAVAYSANAILWATYAHEVAHSTVFALASLLIGGVSFYLARKA